jgi:hypothetical protein
LRLLYFDIFNGECVARNTGLPAFRATITGSKIHKIEASFNVRNIVDRGYDWFIEECNEENASWTKKHRHLMPSLKRLALKESLKHPFKYTNYIQDNPRFPFAIVWNEWGNDEERK